MEQLELIKSKITSIKNEQIELLCKSIKFSIKLMTKIINSFEIVCNFLEKLSQCQMTELLTKIKLFLKITRLVVDKSKEFMKNSQQGKEIEFFTMYSIIY
jgi:hypothetical protein